MTNYRPLQDNIIVKKVSTTTDTTTSGIYTGEIKKGGFMKAEIIAIGPGKDGSTLDAKVGDIIISTQYAPTEMGDDLYVMGFDSVLAVAE
jgi:co-chaperonin GroES (HSP10)